MAFDKRADQQADIRQADPSRETCLWIPAGGDPDQFKAINEAYDVLKDEKKRQIYDEVSSTAVCMRNAMRHKRCCNTKTT
jgi:hypothetical protein